VVQSPDSATFPTIGIVSKNNKSFHLHCGNFSELRLIIYANHATPHIDYLANAAETGRCSRFTH
jgi:hypothetical protein